MFCSVLVPSVCLLCIWSNCLVFSLKEFSLARYNSTAVYANNSVININLVGEGFEGGQITDGGALECHTDDTTCCRGLDNPDGPGRGEWYYPDGTVVPSPGGGTGFYRTRDHMVIRLNRKAHTLSPTGVYRCEIPDAGGVNITRYITLTGTGRCDDLPGISNGTITYTPPRAVSANLPVGQRYTGTIATYSCSPGYQLVNGSSLRACGSDGTWNEIKPSCVIATSGEIQPTSTFSTASVSSTLSTEVFEGEVQVGVPVGIVMAIITVLLVATVTVVTCVVVKKRSSFVKQSSASPPEPSTRRNESYTLRQLENPISEAPPTEPNSSSLDPQYDTIATNREDRETYDTLNHNQQNLHTPQPNPSLVTEETKKYDFCDSEQHTYAVVDKKRRWSSQHQDDANSNKEIYTDIYILSPLQTKGLKSAEPVRAEATNKKGDDFYDVEERTYSVVIKRPKKKTPENGEEKMIEP